MLFFFAFNAVIELKKKLNKVKNNNNKVKHIDSLLYATTKKIRLKDITNEILQ